MQNQLVPFTVNARQCQANAPLAFLLLFRVRFGNPFLDVLFGNCLDPFENDSLANLGASLGIISCGNKVQYWTDCWMASEGLRVSLESLCGEF